MKETIQECKKEKEKDEIKVEIEEIKKSQKLNKKQIEEYR